MCYELQSKTKQNKMVSGKLNVCLNDSDFSWATLSQMQCIDFCINLQRLLFDVYANPRRA